MNTIKLGMIGMGTVATGVVQGLEKNKQLIQARTGLVLKIVSVAVRNLKSPRDVNLDNSIFTNSPNQVVNNPNIDIIIELMGGIDQALEYVTKALENKKHVVTANKALISEYGEQLFTLAQKNGVGLFFEASVAGGVPIIKALQSSLVASTIYSIQGILNGTCNYILSQMEQKINFDTALKDAQEKGYAEANPSLDIDGIDTAQKAAILASLVYGHWFKITEITTQGIRNIQLQDIELAQKLGYKIKLIADIKRANDKTISIRVMPTLIPQKSILGSVDDVFNAIKVHGSIVGESVFYGHGAGKDATASAVCADILEAGKLVQIPTTNHKNFSPYEGGYTGITEYKNLSNRYYVRFMVKNHLQSVIANIGQELGNHKISIASIHQGESDEEFVPVIILTEKTLSKNLDQVIANLTQLAFINEKPIVYPIIE